MDFSTLSSSGAGGMEFGLVVLAGGSKGKRSIDGTTDALKIPEKYSTQRESYSSGDRVIFPSLVFIVLICGGLKLQRFLQRLKMGLMSPEEAALAAASLTRSSSQSLS